MYLSQLVNGFINLVAAKMGLLHFHPFTNSNFNFFNYREIGELLIVAWGVQTSNLPRGLIH
jgi:hypothetical protein